MYYGRSLHTFWWIVLPPASVSKSKPSKQPVRSKLASFLAYSTTLKLEAVHFSQLEYRMQQYNYMLQSLINTKLSLQLFSPPAEEGLNISTVALRVTEGDIKGTWRLGVQLGHPVTGGHKYRDLLLQVGGWMQG
jgi:hypothetical protein